MSIASGNGSKADAKFIKRLAARNEIDRLRAENEAWKQRKTCDTCVRRKGSAKCYNCVLNYAKKPCLWMPAKTALRGEEN